jgi:hypothetical protein
MRSAIKVSEIAVIGLAVPFGCSTIVLDDCSQP